MEKITISYAQSIDGRIATSTGESKYISSNATLNLAHTMRQDHEGICVGIGTVLQDNPQLSCRLDGNPRQPVRVILDTNLRTPLSSNVVQTASAQPSLIIASTSADPKRKAELESAGVQVKCIPESANKLLPPASIISELELLGLGSLFIEGGAGVITSFLKAELATDMVIVTAPVIIGAGTEAIGDLGIRDLDHLLRPEEFTWKQYGSDMVCFIKLK